MYCQISPVLWNNSIHAFKRELSDRSLLWYNKPYWRCVSLALSLVVPLSTSLSFCLTATWNYSLIGVEISLTRIKVIHFLAHNWLEIKSCP